jgi:hypothetical protein
MAQPIGPAGGRWQAATPGDARRLLESVEGHYWIAGGWALDLFLGAPSRPHKDLDVGIRRGDVPRILAALPGWEIFEATEGSLFALDARALPRAGVNSLWARPEGALEWQLEFLLDDSSNEEWIFRRNPVIRLPLERAIRRDAEGIRYLSPEIQLLYKARNVRACDQSDFERVLPRLDDSGRSWLTQALAAAHPGHGWCAMLAS